MENYEEEWIGECQDEDAVEGDRLFSAWLGYAFKVTRANIMEIDSYIIDKFGWQEM